MANRITKKMTITRVAYGLCELIDGEMKYVEKPDLILKGIRSKDYARKQLIKMHGADANISIKEIDAGEHRFSMSMEDFVRIADVDVDDDSENETSEVRPRENGDNQAEPEESDMSVEASTEKDVSETAPPGQDDGEEFLW